MFMTFADVAPDTPCPGVRGGMLHYPHTVGGQPVTMPYGEKRAYGLQPHVLLSLCGHTYLTPPQNDDAQQQRIHADCIEQLRNQPHGDQQPIPAVIPPTCPVPDDREPTRYTAGRHTSRPADHAVFRQQIPKHVAPHR